LIDIRPFLPALLPLGIFLILYISLKGFQKYLASKKRRAPFTDEFFRSPGESLRWRLRKINDELMESLVMILTLPLLFYSLLKHHKGNALEDKQVTRIVHQLDQRCRDVKFSDSDGLGAAYGLSEETDAL